MNLSEAPEGHLQTSANGVVSYLAGPYRLVTRRWVPLSLRARHLPLVLRVPIRLVRMVPRLPSMLSLALLLAPVVGPVGPAPLLGPTSSVPAA